MTAFLMKFWTGMDAFAPSRLLPFARVKFAGGLADEGRDRRLFQAKHALAEKAEQLGVRFICNTVIKRLVEGGDAFAGS